MAEEPEYPEEVGYLIEWAMLLHGRSGGTAFGYTLLSPTEIEAWARLMQLGDLHPLEVEALLLLDAELAVRPDKDTEEAGEDEEPPSDEKPLAPWPERKDN